MEYEIERAFLGTLIAASMSERQFGLFIEYSHRMKSEYFEHPYNAAIFEAVQRLAQERVVVTSAALVNALNIVNPETGEKDLVHIANVITHEQITPANLPYYAKEIEDSYRKRRCQDIASKISQSASIGDFKQALDLARKMQTEYQENKAKGPLEAIAEIRESVVSGKGIPVYRTDVEDLDYLLAEGIKKTALVTIGARPGCGKTAMLIHMAAAKMDLGKRVVFISIEMSDSEIVERLVDWVAKRTIEDDQTTWLAALDKVEHWVKDGILSFHFGSLGMSDIEGICLQEAGGFETESVFIDYLQVIKPEKSHNREREVGEISWRLKQLALTLGCPIFVGAQLNRIDSETEPDVVHLRESGTIENDSYVVILLWPYESDGRYTNIRIKVGKNRSGSHGRCEMLWDKALNIFSSPGTVINEWPEPKKKRGRRPPPPPPPEPTFNEFADWNNGELDEDERYNRRDD